MDDFLLWQIRHFVYNHFADTAHPPSVRETAVHFHISAEEAGEYYKELHNRHAFFLDLETLAVRMANPFSGLPTDFKVHAKGKSYYANCAWDMLGIPAALHTDAVIEAVCTESNDSVRFEIRDGNITLDGIPAAGTATRHLRDGGESKLLVHFPLPFARWYDDLVFT